MVRIQDAHVVGAQAQNGELVVSVEVVLDLELVVVVGRQEGKANRLEQELQITASNGGQIGGLLAQWTVQGQAHFRSSNLENAARLIRASVFEVDFHDGTQTVAALCRKG